MRHRNPDNDPHRYSEENEQRTFKVMETYRGKCALLATWEQQPDEIQIKYHADILRMRATVRKFRNYLLHRADANISL